MGVFKENGTKYIRYRQKYLKVGSVGYLKIGRKQSGYNNHQVTTQQSARDFKAIALIMKVCPLCSEMISWRHQTKKRITNDPP